MLQWELDQVRGRRSNDARLGRNRFQPGERWTNKVSVPKGGPLEVEPDLVVFDDGGFWGRNRGHELGRLMGTKDGARIERDALAPQRQ